MKSAPVQNSSSLASHTCTVRTLFSLLLACFIFPSFLNAQTDTNSLRSTDRSPSSIDTAIHFYHFVPKSSPYFSLTPEQKRKRQWLIGGTNVVGYGTSILIFNNQWYKDHPRTSFHTFNDSKEWLQMDKLGHVWASYNSGRASTAMWKWAGVETKKSDLDWWIK